MEAGRLPARALTTGNRYAYGRGDYVFCLWEAEKVEDGKAVLLESGLAGYSTTDLM